MHGGVIAEAADRRESFPAGPLRPALLDVSAASLPLLYWVWLTWFLVDDAFISLRYARHLAAGEGLRFNLDGGAPVEGYSNLLWVLGAAAVEAVGASPLLWMPAVSTLCGVGVLAVVYGWLRGPVGLSRAPATVATTTLSAFPPFAVWATGGLETMPFALALVAAWRLALTGRSRGAAHGLGVVGLALITLRPEGLAWLGVVAATAWTIDDDRPRRGRFLGLAAAWWVGGALIYGAWKLWWFGALVPNTVRAKVVAATAVWVRGSAYLLLAAATWAQPWLVLALPRLARAPRWEAVRGPAVAGGLVGVWAAVVGGDYLPFHRFLVPAWPLLTVPLGLALDRATAGCRPVLLLWTALAAGLSAWPMVEGRLAPEPLLRRLQHTVAAQVDHYRPDVRTLARERRTLQRNLARARALSRILEPGDSLVARGIGALGYQTDLVILDVYGLVSPEAVEAARARLRAPGHDRRVQRGFFHARDPDVLFAFALLGRSKGEVVDVLPRQWGLFEDVGDGRVYVAELHRVEEPVRFGPRELLLIRRLREDRSDEALRGMKEAFKEAVRQAGYRAPKLLPLDARRREVALEKRTGGDALMEVLWGPRGRPPKALQRERAEER